ncbi:MAG: capsid cement protein [Ignavibacteriaceae bacterium]
MKTEQPILITSVTAVANTAKNLFINFTGAICAANTKALGVSADDALLGEQLPVTAKGIAIVIAGADIAQGAKISSDALGQAVTYTTGDYNGYALDPATSGELVRVLLV